MKPQIVFLPGLGMKEPIFDFQAQTLRDTFQVDVIVLDQQDTLEEMANAVLSKASDQFYLVGHSMGGWVAQKVAIQAPKRVKKLILISTFANTSPKTKEEFTGALQAIKMGQFEAALLSHAQEVVHPLYLSDPMFMNRLRELQQMEPESVYTRQLNAMLKGPDLLSELHKIICPTLIIRGRGDLLFPLAQDQELQQHISGSWFTIIENSAHLAPLEQKEALASLIRLWCQNI